MASPRALPYDPALLAAARARPSADPFGFLLPKSNPGPPNPADARLAAIAAARAASADGAVDSGATVDWTANPMNPNNGGILGTDPIVAAAGVHNAAAARNEGNRSAIMKLGTAAQQKLLRGLGFHVQLDGKPGAQTHAAVWSYLHGHNAGWFNNKGADWQQAVWNKFHVDQGKPSATAQTKPLHPNNSVPPQPSDAPASGPSPMESAINKVLGVSAGADDGSKIGTLVDRASAASSAAELGYGSTIRDLETRIHKSPLEAAAHQAEIGSWYSKLRAQMATGAKDTAATADDLISSQEGAGKAIAAAFGDGANLSSGELSAAGDAEVGNLRALKLIAATGASGADAAVGSSGLSARLRAAATDASQLTDYRSKLADATAESSAAYDKAGADADATNASIEQQRYQNKTAAQTARIAAISSGAALQIRQQTADAATARAAAYTAAKANVAKVPKGSWSATSASDKGKVADAALSAASAMAAAGHSTQEIQKQVMALYASRGWSLTNPRVQAAIRAVLAGVPPTKK